MSIPLTLWGHSPAFTVSLERLLREEVSRAMRLTFDDAHGIASHEVREDWADGAVVHDRFLSFPARARYRALGVLDLSRVWNAASPPHLPTPANLSEVQEWLTHALADGWAPPDTLGADVRPFADYTHFAAVYPEDDDPYEVPANALPWEVFGETGTGVIYTAYNSIPGGSGVITISGWVKFPVRGRLLGGPNGPKESKAG